MLLAKTRSGRHRPPLSQQRGRGTFTDVTEALRAEEIAGWGFTAGWLDYDNDSDLDLYLANDVRGTRYLYPNVLFRNDGPGCGNWCFTDVSESSGTDVRADSMGLAVGDYDNDLDLDLYFTNTGWAHMPLTGPAVLLRNRGDGSFEDVSRESWADVDAVSWGAVFLDYDNDGFQDLYVALGGDPEGLGPWVRQNRLLRNRGDGSFEDVSAQSGASQVDDTFGLASADYNNDGWSDLVAGNIDEGYDLYANTGAAGEGNHRLSVRLQGGGPVNRDAVGARVYLTTTDGRTQMREVMAGSSLGAGNDLALGFGLGKESVRSLRVLWPDGSEQTFKDVPSDIFWRLAYEGEPETFPLADASVPRPALGASPQPISGGVRAGGYLVPALALLATLGLLGWLLALRLGLSVFASRLLVALVLGVLSFQLVHFVEHLLQFGHWLAHPGEEPWITPWGRVATDGLAALSGHHGGRATGTELLHLFGNWITFVGILAVYVALRRRRVGPWRMRATRVAFWLQLVHVLEHVSLTTTFFMLGTPIGLSTLLGHSFHLEGACAPSIRIWWHFAMVLVPTTAFILALIEFRRAVSLTTTAPPASEGYPTNRPRMILYPAAAFSSVAALIHLWAMSEHFEEWWGYGTFFLVAAITQGLYALVLLRWPGRWLFLLGIGGNLAIVVLYLATRTVGIPFFGPHAGEVERVGAIDLAASSSELALVCLLVTLSLDRARKGGRDLTSSGLVAVDLRRHGHPDDDNAEEGGGDSGMRTPTGQRR